MGLILALALALRGRKAPAGVRGRLDPAAVAKARKRYVAAIDKRLAGKIDHYSLLLDSRNLINGFYEQKGLVVGVRFAVKEAHCARCKALDGKQFSLLEAEKVAAHTPPIHGEVRKGVRCMTTLIALQAEEASAKLSKR